jgi:hypothetical protein
VNITDGVDDLKLDDNAHDYDTNNNDRGLGEVKMRTEVMVVVNNGIMTMLINMTTVVADDGIDGDGIELDVNVNDGDDDSGNDAYDGGGDDIRL